MNEEQGTGEWQAAEGYDREQLRILKEQGVAGWNAWRKANFRVIPKLTGANLTGVPLEHANLSHAELEHARLRKAALEGADLQGAHPGWPRAEVQLACRVLNTVTRSAMPDSYRVA